MTRLLAAMWGLLVAAAWIFCAPSAQADDDDDLFLFGLETENINLSDSTAIAAGHAVCSDFASGATQEEVVFNAMDNTGLSLEDAGFLAGGAVYVYCRQFESRIH